MEDARLIAFLDAEFAEFVKTQPQLATRLAPQLATVDAAALPHAADLARLAAAAYARGVAVSPDLVEPAYLRNNVALTLAEQRARPR